MKRFLENYFGIPLNGGDWLNSTGASFIAWWSPKLAIFLTIFVAVSFRTVVWVIAPLWMGTACILNAKRCGRTHCRYTGPYYLAMILPVLVSPPHKHKVPEEAAGVTGAPFEAVPDREA